VTLHEDEYIIDEVVSGTCLLKIVIRESHIDTNATTRIICEQLTKLDKFMVLIYSDIIKFNDHVKELLQQLHARGGTTHDLLSNLLKAYKVIKDKEFTKYINDKKNEYDEGKDFNPSQLMLLASNKFKTMKQDDEWNAPSEEQEQIMALQAQVNKLKQSKANKGDGPINKGRDKSTSENKYRRTSKKGYNNSRIKPKWMMIPPKEGKRHEKTVKGKKYHWCPKHEAWVRHIPSKCRGKGNYFGKRKVRFADDEQNNQQPEETSKHSKNKKLKVAKALASILEEDSD